MLNHLRLLSYDLGGRQLILGGKGPKDKRALQLYEYIKRTASPTKEGAAAILSCAVNSSVLNNSCAHLEKVILDNLTMVRPGDINTTDPKSARLYAWKLLGIGAGQLIEHQSKLLVPFLEEAFELAEKFGFITVAKVASSLLILRTTTPHLNREKYLYYHDKNVYYENLYLDYELIRLSLLEIEQGISSGNKPRESALALDRLAVQSLRASNRHHHPKLTLLHKFIQLRTAYSYGDHDLIVELAAEAMEWVKNGPEYLRSEEAGLLIVLCEAYLLADDYENGYPYLQELIRGFNHSPRTHYKLLEMKCLLCLRTGKFQQAIAATRELEHRNNKYGINSEEGLQLFKAYGWFITKLKPSGTPDDEAPAWLNRKKIEAILPNGITRNNPKMQKHAQVIKIIYLLSQKKYKQAKAAFRSLLKVERPTTSTRYRHFVKMLEVAFQQGLHRVAVERHTTPILKKLINRPTAPASINELEEVIPYPVIWSILLEQLGHKRLTIK